MSITSRNNVVKPFVWLMTVILMLFTFTPSITNAQESDNDFTQEELDQAIKTLKAIEEIPDELLESGDSEAINQYFTDKGITSNVYNPNMGEVAPMIMQPYGWWGCSLAVAELLVMNAIPIAKLTKIKKYVKQLGGAVETAKLLVGATTAKEKAAILSALVAELTGFTNVKTSCNL
ncbi:hypothetical protein [Sporosarcina ureae]|uniref:hypothetical protein n=1 Tax=Sporosarcina ureae TaxID=1571 RepID=UPI0028AEA16C|nr:hypothetical protein [Sporosarcina ureae]